MRYNYKGLVRHTLWALLFAFLLANCIAFAHAYKFTHFSPTKNERTKDPKELSFLNKLQILFTGIDNPKPQHKTKPSQTFRIVALGKTKKVRCWQIKADHARGTVILFHGYAGEKSSLVGRADYFHKLGYNTLLVDFLGSGDSDGNSTSIGYHESEQVKWCYDFVKDTGEQNIFLFGTSMGSAAILKAVNDYDIKPSGIIVECPFGSLYKTVCARFKLMSVPGFPMAGLLTFWGGVQHGYWAFVHNPQEYAKHVTCPTLILFGAQDDRVTVNETRQIYANLKGLKTLKIYPTEGHNVFTPRNEVSWKQDVSEFISALK